MKRGSGGNVLTSSMEFLPNEIEMKHLRNNPLTVLEDGHYKLNPQRGCFLRCSDCFNLSQAESVEGSGGAWYFTNECLFCVQRVIDLLGYYEHGVVPKLVVSATPKKREHEPEGIYSAIMKSIEAQKNEEEEPRSDVFDDCVGGEE